MGTRQPDGARAAPQLQNGAALDAQTSPASGKRTDAQPCGGAAACASVLTVGHVPHQQWRRWRRTRSVATAEAEAVGMLAMAGEARRQRTDG
eukprot:scaffold113590_cov33-Phaeocystis_antarctica.AAC.2